MKRLVAVVSLLAAAVPALAELRDSPFEQTQLDRELPNIVITAPASAYLADGSAPYEQNQVDRLLPDLEEGPVRYAMSGSTMSDASIATEGNSESVWARDHNFIAPAQ